MQLQPRHEGAVYASSHSCNPMETCWKYIFCLRSSCSSYSYSTLPDCMGRSMQRLWICNTVINCLKLNKTKLLFFFFFQHSPWGPSSVGLSKCYKVRRKYSACGERVHWSSAKTQYLLGGFSVLLFPKPSQDEFPAQTSVSMRNTGDQAGLRGTEGSVK